MKVLMSSVCVLIRFLNNMQFLFYHVLYYDLFSNGFQPTQMMNLYHGYPSAQIYSIFLSVMKLFVRYVLNLLTLGGAVVATLVRTYILYA